MKKVTRILYSKNINKCKYQELLKQATLLGRVRSEVWSRYSSINGSKIKSHRERSRKSRSKEFVGAVVGYTNAGKSSLINVLAKRPNKFFTMSNETLYLRYSHHYY